MPIFDFILFLTIDYFVLKGKKIYLLRSYFYLFDVKLIWLFLIK